jgi:hypothetical protein
MGFRIGIRKQISNGKGLFDLSSPDCFLPLSPLREGLGHLLSQRWEYKMRKLRLPGQGLGLVQHQLRKLSLFAILTWEPSMDCIAVPANAHTES